ncbi:MAG: hypothetical protein HKN11_18495 [Rhizobiales bacterium]|nr:hypothetical protein [Hyphomicrobiales bacterium]
MAKEIILRGKVMKLQRYHSALAFSLLLAVSPAAANAECQGASGHSSVTAPATSGNTEATADTPTQIVETMVEDASESTTGNGEKYAGTGPAKPVENWFGCKPGNTKCLSEKGEAQIPGDDDQTSAGNTTMQSEEKLAATGNTPGGTPDCSSKGTQDASG